MVENRTVQPDDTPGCRFEFRSVSIMRLEVMRLEVAVNAGVRVIRCQLVDMYGRQRRSEEQERRDDERRRHTSGQAKHAANYWRRARGSSNTLSSESMRSSTEARPRLSHMLPIATR